MELADPERALAVSYAPADRRTALATLFALDERLGAVVAGTTEIGIGLIRLAWWREALVALDTRPIPPEPLLAALGQDVLPWGVSGADLAELEAGWANLLEEPLAANCVDEFGSRRGGTLFVLAGRLLGAVDKRLHDAGEGWALADLAHRHSNIEVRGWAQLQAQHALRSVSGGWPRRLLPLGALTILAQRDAHAPGARRQGSPGRLLRLLVLRIARR